MRFLVTGASGFIGSNLAVELSQKHEVVGLCKMDPGTKENLNDFRGTFVSGDIRTFDFDSLGRFDGIFHQAAITDTTVTDQTLMTSTNIDATLRILEFAQRTRCPKVVYASSAATYGKGKVPMSETDTPAPANIYGESKVQMEIVTREFCAKFPAVKAVGLRYFNVYGPREVHKIKAASMVYQLYQQIASGKSPRIFKWGDQFRDFIYVKDVVRANIKAFEFTGNGVFNVGTGIPTSFNRIIEVINSELNVNRATEYFDNPYSFYQDETQADTASAKSTMGFECSFTPESGIRDYVRILESQKKSSSV